MKKLIALALFTSAAIGLVGCASSGSNPTTAAGNAHEVAEGLEFSHLSNQNIRALYSRLSDYVIATRNGNKDAADAHAKSLAQSATRYRKALEDAQLDTESAYRRGIANTILAFTGDPKVAYSISVVAANPEERADVRSRAALGLAILGQRINESPQRREIMDAIKTMMLPIEEADSVRLNAVAAYSAAYNKAMGDEVAPLLRVLGDDVNLAVREQAVFGIGQVADPASVVDLANIAIKDDEPRIRAASANALGKIRSPLALEALRRVVVEDGSGMVRAEAIYALSGQTGVADDKDLVDLVIAGTADIDEIVREAAARAAGKIGSIDSVRSLLALTQDRSTQVRISAITAIGDVTPREQEVEAIELINTLNDGDPYVVRATQRSLQKITGENYGSSTKAWTEYYYGKYPDRSVDNYTGPIPPVSLNSTQGNNTRRTTTPRTSTRSNRNSRNTSNTQNRFTQRRTR